MIARPNSTYLLPYYTIPCDGVVYGWEFCYLAISDTNPVTFYPSIWRPSDADSHTSVNINRVTFTAIANSGFQCLNHTVSDNEQFSVLTGDIVGLYSSADTWLASNRNSSLVSFIYTNSNQSGTVDNTGRSLTDEMRAIKVHISKDICLYVEA